WKIGTRDSFEAEDETAGTDVGLTEQEPFAQVERCARRCGAVIAALVLFEALGQGDEVRQREIARGSAKERAFLVDRLERRDLEIGETDRCNDRGHSTPGAHVEGARGHCRGRSVTGGDEYS